MKSLKLVFWSSVLVVPLALVACGKKKEENKGRPPVNAGPVSGGSSADAEKAALAKALAEKAELEKKAQSCVLDPSKTAVEKEKLQKDAKAAGDKVEKIKANITECAGKTAGSSAKVKAMTEASKITLELADIASDDNKKESDGSETASFHLVVRVNGKSNKLKMSMKIPESSNATEVPKSEGKVESGEVVVKVEARCESAISCNYLLILATASVGEESVAQVAVMKSDISGTISCGDNLVARLGNAAKSEALEKILTLDEAANEMKAAAGFND